MRCCTDNSVDTLVICYYIKLKPMSCSAPWVAAQAVRWSGIPKVATDSVQQVLWFAARIALCNTWSSGGTALSRVGGATSQLDLPSLTPLSVAGCGRLQLGAPHWATSVNYCKQFIIEPTFCGSRFSTGRLPAIEDFTFFLQTLNFIYLRYHII